VYNLALGLGNAIQKAVGDLVDRLFGESAETPVISLPKNQATRSKNTGAAA
jgi:hypothetical protein